MPSKLSERCMAPAVGGACHLPAGHNRGRADIPANHVASNHGLTHDVQRCTLRYMTNINLPLPEELLKQIDSVRGDVPRTVWIRRAIEQRLAKEKS